ncbi:MAG: hypothetical protein ACI8PB_002595 [Desulforhopalus sp.]|jgi:hypothetical protein
MNIDLGRHRHMTYAFLGLHFLLRLRSDNKKSPPLTLPQAQRLIAAVLPLASLSIRVALEIVRHHRKRNFVAYQCHKKRNLKKVEVLLANVSL